MLDKPEIRCAVIITALSIEYEAIRAHLTDIHEEVHKGSVYEAGKFSFWKVGIVEIGAGNAGAAFETERAINYFQPEIILFVGVAGGLKDVNLGDVVSATKVYAYESGKAGIHFETRPIVWTATYDMEQRARAEARKADWRQRIDTATPVSSHPKVLVAPIAAGEKVISSINADAYQLLRSQYSDAVAVEMEGHGFLQAVHANKSLSALVIRGISDLIENKREADAANYQKIASQNASAFAFEMLTKFVEKPRQDHQVPLQNQIRTPSSESASGGDTLEIFYSYAREDERYATQLQKQLIMLKRRGLITDWYGGKIAAGEELSEHIKHLNSAHIILLLISPDFVSSEHHYQVEVLRAMERYKAKETIVVPIILRPTEGWRDAPFGRLQPIPRGNKAITEYRDLDVAFRDVAQKSRSIVEKLKNATPN